jgi:nucleotide-binding universal stress UspA family protein
MYQKILVPLDGSELAECALPEVKRLINEGFPREIILLSVYKIPTYPIQPGFDHYYSTKKSRIEQLQAYLEGIRSRLSAKDITVKTAIEEGDAGKIIVDYSLSQDVDLIVIATHGYGGMKRLMFGSVALQVLHDAQVPILLIRPEGCKH